MVRRKAKGIRRTSVAFGKRVLSKMQTKLKSRQAEVKILKASIKKAKKSISKQKKRKL